MRSHGENKFRRPEDRERERDGVAKTHCQQRKVLPAFIVSRVNQHERSRGKD